MSMAFLEGAEYAFATKKETVMSIDYADRYDDERLAQGDESLIFEMRDDFIAAIAELKTQLSAKDTRVAELEKVAAGGRTAAVYVYQRTEPQLWTVGYYTPTGKWEAESDHSSRDEAAKHVAWLNGATDVDMSQAQLNRATQIIDDLKQVVANLEAQLTGRDALIDKLQERLKARSDRVKALASYKLQANAYIAELEDKN